MFGRKAPASLPDVTDRLYRAAPMLNPRVVAFESEHRIVLDTFATQRTLVTLTPQWWFVGSIELDDEGEPEAAMWQTDPIPLIESKSSVDDVALAILHHLVTAYRGWTDTSDPFIANANQARSAHAHDMLRLMTAGGP